MVWGGRIRAWSGCIFSETFLHHWHSWAWGISQILFCKCDWGLDMPVLTVFILRELPSVCVCVSLSGWEWDRHPSSRSEWPMHSQTDSKWLSQNCEHARCFNCRVVIIVSFSATDWALYTLDPIIKHVTCGCRHSSSHFSDQSPK